MIAVATLFIGAAIGAGTMILIGLWLVARPKTEAPQHNEISAVGVNMGNPITEAVQCDKAMLEKVLRAYGADKFIELGPTRH
jgi:hypothetical protein